MKDWSKGKFTIVGDAVKFNGELLPRELHARILEMARKGDDPTSFFKFWERLQKNPSYRSVQQLWNFLKHHNLPLTADGHFLAYKNVKQDYKDHHSNTFSNKPGTINKMPRNQISDDQNHECDPGFHVGAVEYARTFGGGRMVICKIDPENVVSVPRDNNGMKMRVCEYEVVGNYGEDLPTTVFAEDAEDESLPVLDPEPDEDSVEEPSVVTTHEVALGEDVKGTATSTSKAKAKRSKAFVKLDRMDTAQLLGETLDTLRQYAGKGWDIVGASKIPGGKSALIAAIMKARQ